MYKRLFLPVAVVVTAFFAGDFIIGNFLASSLIAYGHDAASRDAAARWAPNNPTVIAARGKFLFYRADPPRAEEAIADLQRAVLASPSDYRFWLELGRAYENTGEIARAEAALMRAADLAPRYFETRWALANLRLRSGRTDDALNDFREAILLAKGNVAEGETRPEEKATFNILNTVAGVAGADFDDLRRIVPSDSASQAYLSIFFADRGELDRALEIWRGLAPGDPKSYQASSFRLLRGLLAENRYPEAQDVWLKFSGYPKDSSNLITNPGFEQKPSIESYPELGESRIGFDWIIRRHSEVRARRTDSEKRSGSHSLQLTIAAPMSSEFREVSQLISVERSQNYRLSYFVKTKNLSSLPDEAPYVEIGGRRSLAPPGTNDWVERSLSFSTRANESGVFLTIRCPRLLTVDRARIVDVWFDDFKLEKVENAKHAK